MTEDNDSDEDLQNTRGRPLTARANGKGMWRNVKINGKTSRTLRNGIEEASPSGSGGSSKSSPAKMPERLPFTRSRSPAVHAFGFPHRTQSPSVGTRAKQTVPTRTHHLLPGAVNIRFRIPFTVPYWMVSIDVRQAVENCILLASLGYGAHQLRGRAGDAFSPDMWITIGKFHVITPDFAAFSEIVI